MEKKQIFYLSCSPEKKILNETKNHNPPCKLNGRSLIYMTKSFYLNTKFWLGIFL
jgi:hypothetical protein